MQAVTIDETVITFDAFKVDVEELKRHITEAKKGDELTSTVRKATMVLC